MSARVELHIGELVLPAAWARERAEVAAALEHELERLIGQGELPSLLERKGEHRRLDPQPLEPARPASAIVLGEATARAIDAELRR